MGRLPSLREASLAAVLVTSGCYRSATIDVVDVPRLSGATPDTTVRIPERPSGDRASLDLAEREIDGFDEVTIVTRRGARRIEHTFVAPFRAQIERDRLVIEDGTVRRSFALDEVSRAEIGRYAPENAAIIAGATIGAAILVGLAAANIGEDPCKDAHGICYDTRSLVWGGAAAAVTFPVAVILTSDL